MGTILLPVYFLTALYHEDVNEMVAGLGIKNVKGLVITSAGTSKQEIGPRKKGSLLEVKFSLEIWLHPGEYFVRFELRKAALEELYDKREDSLHFTVASYSKGKVYWGLVSLPQETFIRNISLSRETT